MRLFLVGVLCGLFPFSASFADHLVTPDSKLKAALLYKLTWFVEWPVSAFSATPKRFKFCILGENTFGNTLAALEQRQIKDMPIELRFYRQSDEIDEHCNMLFISNSKAPFVSEILNRVEAPGTLTVSGVKGFARAGGMIELRQFEDTIGFNINLDSVRRNGLRIAAPLLEMTNVISDTGK